MGERRACDAVRVTPEELAHLRRARDLMDREYARPLDVPAMARAALTMDAPGPAGYQAPQASSLN